jgi:cupin 2 domain-containing protein
MSPNNIFACLPGDLTSEVIEDLLRAKSVRIERIISKGHSTPSEEWYDQAEHEWVLVLEGAGTIRFADGREVTLRRGDHLNIPAHTRHQVAWTAPGETTLWLAIFYKS